MGIYFIIVLIFWILMIAMSVAWKAIDTSFSDEALVGLILLSGLVALMWPLVIIALLLFIPFKKLYVWCKNNSEEVEEFFSSLFG